ncbi:MAG: acyl carrier protein [Ktedonobacteraceae bacterium]|nr:acyl carrier protein [Ktedonobacteraceae bacterium]
MERQQRAQASLSSIKEIDPRLQKIVLEQLGVDEMEVIPHASLGEDLNADSLDLVESMISLEEVFKVKNSDEDMERLTTIRETQAYL